MARNSGTAGQNYNLSLMLYLEAGKGIAHFPATTQPLDLWIGRIFFLTSDQVFRLLACVSSVTLQVLTEGEGEQMDLKQYCTSNVACTNITCFIASLIIHSSHQSSGTKSMRHFMLCFKDIIIVCFEATFFFPFVNQAICWSTQFCNSSQE